MNNPQAYLQDATQENVRLTSLNLDPHLLLLNKIWEIITDHSSEGMMDIEKDRLKFLHKVGAMKLAIERKNLD